MPPTIPVPISLSSTLSNLVSSPLYFTASQTFHLSIFQDLHFGEAESTLWGPLQDADTLEVIQTVLDTENNATQLVVLNGDLITGEDTFQENATDYVDVLVKPLVERGLVWASTYGNHDSDFNLSRTAIYSREKAYPNSLTGNMVQTNDSGVTNYYLPVYAYGTSVTADTVPALLLWFFDSRGGNYYQQQTSTGTSIGQPNWVSPDVVAWFNSTRTALATLYSPCPLPPSLAFVHIPTDASLAFQTSSSSSGGGGGGVDAHREPGINADDPLSQQGVQSGEGSSQTTFAYEGQDVPFMQALLGTENLMGVFSGHDHGNDWCAKWDGHLEGMTLVGNGVDLCFSRHTGYGGYGSWTRGSRQIRVSLGEESGNAVGVETWTRLEDGSVTGRVTLNATYGMDEYPEVPLTYTSEYDEGVPYTK